MKIPNYDYSINEDCEITNDATGRILKLTPNGKDNSITALQVRLSKDGITKKFLLGRLVAEMKYGPCPKGKVAGINESESTLWDKICWVDRPNIAGRATRSTITFDIYEAQKIADEITNGVPLKTIASRLGVSAYVIKQVVKEMGVPTLGRHTHKNPKLDEAKIREAQALWLAGMNYTTIGNRLGISRWCIRRVLRSSCPSSLSGLSNVQ